MQPDGSDCDEAERCCANDEVMPLYLREITIRWDRIPDTGRYPFSIPALRDLKTISLRGHVTCFVGENGSGKSTVLEAIAYQCGFNTAGGSRDEYFGLHKSGTALGDYISLSWLPKVMKGFFLRAETFYQFATHLDQLTSEGAGILSRFGGRSLHDQSHGEAFLSLFVHHFGDAPRAIYLLDEPEAALSPARQLAFLRVMHDLRDRAQFIIATHSPILLGYPGAQILSFDTSPAAEISYEETEHFQVTQQFLNRREVVLGELFQEDE